MSEYINNKKIQESILLTIRKMLGYHYDHFDTDLIVHINTYLGVLCQLGVGPSTSFTINDEKATWADFLQNENDLDGVKTYLYYRVKLAFDPPANSSVQESMKKMADELEWRLNVTVDPRLDES